MGAFPSSVCREGLEAAMGPASTKPTDARISVSKQDPSINTKISGTTFQEKHIFKTFISRFSNYCDGFNIRSQIL